MRTLGRAAIDPRPRLSPGGADPQVSPSRLRGLVPHRPPQVWSAESTSIPLRPGCMSLVARLDGYRRSGVAWHRAPTMDGAWGVSARAEARAHGHPERCTTAQGAPLTALAFTTRLTVAPVAMRRDGRGRVCDHRCVER